MEGAESPIPKAQRPTSDPPRVASELPKAPPKPRTLEVTKKDNGSFGVVNVTTGGRRRNKHKRTRRNKHKRTHRNKHKRTRRNKRN